MTNTINNGIIDILAKQGDDFLEKINILTSYSIDKFGKSRMVSETMESGLKSMQEKVDGYIECLRVTPEINLWCNEEGKILNPPLPMNILLLNRGEPYDVIRGNAFFTSHDNKGNTTGLKQEHIEEIQKRTQQVITEEGIIYALEMS